MGAVVTTRDAGGMGSWKHEEEWAIATALTRFEPRIKAVEVQVKEPDGRINIVVRYETAPGASAAGSAVQELRRRAAAFINGWTAARANFEARARKSALPLAK